MKKRTLFTYILAGLSLFSCKDFLDVKPSNSTDSSVTIQTLADAKVMTNGLLRDLVNASYYGRNFMIYGDAKGGDLTIASQGRGLDALYVFNHSVNNNSYSGFWSQGYTALLQANNIIKSITTLQASGTDLDFNDYLGQALTLRAMIHFDLVRLYGKSYTDAPASYGVAIVTEPLETTALLTRQTVAETYTQIVKDLTEAEGLLSKSKNNGYINYFANKALQARVYLHMGDFDKAYTAAKAVIDEGANLYSLYSNDDWSKSWASQFGSESLFEIAIAKDQGDLESGSLGSYYLKNGDSDALGNFMASDYYLDRLGEDEDDVRWGILTEDELGRNGACYKYVGSVAKTGDGKETFTAVNIKVIRLSEVYLIAAESALKKSSPDRSAAATYLNAIRKRSPNLALATAATIDETLILNEKSKELLGEGQRYWDMIRLNKTITFNDEHVGVNLSHREKSINRSFYKAILPIPLDEINANPAIADQQNPNY